MAFNVSEVPGMICMVFFYKEPNTIFLFSEHKEPNTMFLMCFGSVIKIEFSAHTVKEEKLNFTAKQWPMVGTLIFSIMFHCLK
jgi:hypothetical protein